MKRTPQAETAMWAAMCDAVQARLNADRQRRKALEESINVATWTSQRDGLQTQLTYLNACIRDDEKRLETFEKARKAWAEKAETQRLADARLASADAAMKARRPKAA